MCAVRSKQPCARRRQGADGEERRDQNPKQIGPGTLVRVHEVVQTLFPSRTIQGLALSNVLEHDGARRWVISLFFSNRPKARYVTVWRA